jgi:hypothetical protein
MRLLGSVLLNRVALRAVGVDYSDLTWVNYSCLIAWGGVAITLLGFKRLTTAIGYRCRLLENGLTFNISSRIVMANQNIIAITTG